MAKIIDYFGHLEWEILQNKFQIESIENNPNLPKNIQKIELWRNDNYTIQAKLISTGDDIFRRGLDKEVINGELIDKFTIKGKTSSDLKVELHNCFIKRVKSSWNGSSKESNLDVDISTTRIEVNYSHESETHWLTDWYLNGSNILLPRGTNREITLSYKRLRNDFGQIKTEYTNDYFYGGVDFAYINADQIKFLLTKVKDNIGPSWSHNFGIEYRKEFDFLPTLEQRKAISEIVSFILGKQLINVGCTKYGYDGKLIERSAISPKDNIVTLCHKSSREPIDISNSSKIQSILNKVVPSYLILRDELDLNFALYIYWSSLEVPLEVNLPILASALEIIMKKWFKNAKSKTKGLYMEKQKFSELLKDDLSSIKEKLKDEEFGTQIYNKINSSYNSSVTDRFHQFFDEIDLKIGPVENSAIKSRNKMAHGDMTFDDAESKDMLKNTLAYGTLFNRVFLRILGYDGDYIDRSTLGFPKRHIDTQLGGD